MKILVTGGAGFIGSWLCEYLVGKGETVTCMDNLSTGSKENIKHLLSSHNFSFIEHDVTKPFNMKADQIYHLASMASPVHYQKYPVETALSNSLGTNNVIQVALRNDATLLFSSTSEVYGDPKEHPQKEGYWGHVNPIGPRSCYDESKRFGEALIMAYVKQHNLKAKIVRIFNTYGPRMRPDDGRGIPNFIRQALSKEPMTVYGNGRQTRSYCYVEDLVEGLWKMMNSEETGPINLGNPDEYTVMETAKIIKKVTASPSEITLKELPEDDPKKRKPDITKAMEALGWSPTVELEDGLKKTIDYFRTL
jgi:nucleoside-diphosphate-sugar epimerase